MLSSRTLSGAVPVTIGGMRELRPIAERDDETAVGLAAWAVPPWRAAWQDSASRTDAPAPTIKAEREKCAAGVGDVVT